MGLSDNIQVLRDQVLGDLSDAHDYYLNTKVAWRIVHKVLKAGHPISIRNVVTGTVTTQVGLAAKAHGYVAQQLTEATFQQFISLFEAFYFDIIRLWLTAYPGSLGKRMIDFKTVLELPDKESIAQVVIRKELNEAMYDRPTEWFSYLEDRAGLGCPSTDEVARIAEAKASRDILVHAKGLANKTYEKKAGKLARVRDGEQMDIPEQYHRETWNLIRKVVSDISNAAIAKTQSSGD
jgi:hypothetical protein